jgi:hypothetical protein
MGIIELYKDSPNTLWQNDETFLCVFDEKENLIADYDLCTGLKLMQGEKDMTIYINEDDLVSGKWILLATKTKIIDGEHIKTKIRANGFKEEGGSLDIFKENDPWSKNCGSQDYVSRQERERRLSICKGCPLFNKDDMLCSINNQIVLQTTKYQNEYCPEDKWGNKEDVFQRLAENGLIPRIEIDKEEQDRFESELEEYFKGL